MKSHVEKHVKIFLELDRDEARWLRDLVQNPINLSEEEDPKDRGLRQKFWDALSDVDNI